MKTTRGMKLFAAASALTLGLAACGNSTPEKKEDNAGKSDAKASGLSGTINGSGATAQQKAQQAWRDNFTKANPGVVVNYDGTGSGTGREQFISGKVVYAGTDSLLKDEEIQAATKRCGSEPLELPLYISPIAVAFNLPGIKHLNMTGEIIAKIFDGKIKKWNDAAIADINKDAKLPDLPIIPVNRADDSGTSKNFQQYLVAASNGSWGYEPADKWPVKDTQSAEGTSGVINLVKSTEGAITYADASQIENLGSAAVEVAGEFLPYSPEAAAAIVDGSQPKKNATDRLLAYDLKRDGSIKGAYPIVLVSYVIACTDYKDANDGKLVKSYLSYIASKEGQEVATKAKGGNAPISDALRAKVTAAIDLIKG
ncbi:phosphate ABC transporter substrate-binding protein PstS [Arcanobacterium hippocoleae]|uniref:Phosphate-binding protein n=1 Tax=Arcanobacterium hippocoleae TaxID=149017 RepID=A0ABU1T200_9ACTO|nr:phosphate ABC transporter substrate-binding protein PstS [Arcanobacterium hippocoleae]MDR6939343.1 phosphate transport system substrate-binding protein [Arcanobacterium hippocoleae]